MTDESSVETDLMGTDHSSQAGRRRAATQRAVMLGLWVNAFLALMKMTVGILGNSQALRADGINSLADVVYYIVMRIFVTLSAKPADEEHPYGHQQFESIAAVVVAAFVITTGLSIFWDAVNNAVTIVSSDGAVHKPLRLFSLYAACATIVIKVGLLLHAHSVARRTRSIAVWALARDHRNDMIASGGAGIGIVCALAGYPLWDPIAGALVAVVVMKTGADILRESSRELMDTVPSKKIDAHVRRIAAATEGVQRVDEVHAHRFGPYLVLNVAIAINGDLRVAHGEEIASTVEQQLYTQIENLGRVYIHVHPA
jgi:cation diffusion facilitator family transporter